MDMVDEREQGTGNREQVETDHPTPHDAQTGASGALLDRRHEAHHHARPRLLWGVAAIVVVVAGIVVWSEWGDEIHEACFGDNGACEVDFSDMSASADFDIPEGF